MADHDGPPLGVPGTVELPSERRRVVMCAGPGAIAGIIGGWLVLWQLAVLVGWLVTATALLIWVWHDIGGLDATGTQAISTREDDSRAVVRVVLVLASVVSLVGVVAGLHRSSTVDLGWEIALTVASLLCVVLSWTVVHSMFVLRYAHLYYGGAHVGGIEFPGDEAPSYRDFAYLGFTVGMTFQVSDTDITDTTMRATVLRHALLSYLFGTAIIASTISVLAGIVG